MFSSADKTAKAAPAIQAKAAPGLFFRKAGEDAFFGAKETPAFFGAPVQAKLTVSKPDDPHEKEADAMAEHVMRMPEPPGHEVHPAEEKLQHREDESPHAKLETTASLSIHHSVPEDKLHAKTAEPSPGDRGVLSLFSPTDRTDKSHDPSISLYGSDVLRQSGRGPPTGSPSFEQSLGASKGSGSPLPTSTLQFMESRFGADFSGVRIHTGAAAESMTAQVQAQAFAHGRDIYFNSGKYSPDSTGGRHLLAHELTHTLQQGASPVRPAIFSRLPQQTSRHTTTAGPAAEERTTPAGTAASPAMLVQARAGMPDAAPSTPAVSSLSVKARSPLQLAGLSPEEGVQKEGREQEVLPDAPLHLHTTSALPSVQRALYDGALAHVGEFISDIPLLDLTSLEAARQWLMTGVRRFASYIPGYRALGVALGHDPITGEEIARNGHTFLEAGLDLMPGGALIKQKLEETGLLDKAAAWIDAQLGALSAIIQHVRSEFLDFWNGLGLSSILDGPAAILRSLGNLLERAITQVMDFARRAATELTGIIKSFLLNEVAGFVKQHTNAYELLKVIMGKDPITDEPVARNGTNILHALLELGGEAGREQRKQLQDTHTFEKAAAWIDRGIAVLGDLYAGVRAGFSHIWNAVSIEALMHPIDTFNRIWETFAAPVRRVLAFVQEALSAMLGFVKEALMIRLSAWAKGIRGYPLVTVILGQDPFTRSLVPRSVENLVHGFMSLMEGGEEQFTQLQASGVLGRAAQRINAAVARLNMTPAYVMQLFSALWQSFTFTDLVNPAAAFQRIMARFGEPIGRLIAFVVEIIRIVVELVLQVMNFPSDLIGSIIARAMQAFDMIKKDPVGFLKNLLRGIKQGFVQFFNNIGRHLIAGLQAWLMSELKDTGVKAPADFSLKSLIGWVLDLLGISMEKIWEKLAKHPRIGPERVARLRGMIDKLEGIWTFIKDIQQRGMAAVWDKIQERLSSLWDTLLDAIKNWIMEQVVNRVTAKLLSMLDPTGIMAVINSAIALYRAVQSFIRYLRQLLEIINSFVEGVVQIASGNISVAANFLERAMARGVPVMIGFLANQVGLSGLGKRIAEMIEKVRGLVDQALTWLVNKAVDGGMALLDKVMGRNTPQGAGGAEVQPATRPFSMNGESHHLYLVMKNGKPDIEMASGKRAQLRMLVQNALKELHDKEGPQWNEMRGQLIHLLDHELDPFSPVAAAATPQTQQQYEQRLANISTLLGVIGSAFHVKSLEFVLPVSTPPVFGGTHQGFATSMEIAVLTKDAPPGMKGSPVSNSLRSVGHMAALDKRLSGGGKYYVLGHLLNANLHGPGTTTSNLTPITGSANGLHLSQIEDPVKTGIAQDRIFSYKVSADYSRSLDTAKRDEFLKAGDKVRAGIVEAEQHVPMQLLCTVQELMPDGSLLSGGFSKTGFPVPVTIDTHHYEV